MLGVVQGLSQQETVLLLHKREKRARERKAAAKAKERAAAVNKQRMEEGTHT